MFIYHRPAYSLVHSNLLDRYLSKNEYMNEIDGRLNGCTGRWMDGYLLPLKI